MHQSDVIPSAPEAGEGLTSRCERPCRKWDRLCRVHRDCVQRGGTCPRPCHFRRIVGSLTGPSASFGMTSLKLMASC